MCACVCACEYIRCTCVNVCLSMYEHSCFFNYMYASVCIQYMCQTVVQQCYYSTRELVSKNGIPKSTTTNILFLLPAHRYDGCWNGYDYDCCTHRRPNLYYPSLVKPFPYYYRCINRRVVYGRCAAHQCVTESGSCG